MNEKKRTIMLPAMAFVLMATLIGSGVRAEMISHYDFEEPNPFDDKISGAVATVGANVTIESGTPHGNAAVFPDGNRTDSDILVAQADAPVIGLSDFTCMAWVRRAAVTTEADGICDMVTGTTEGGFQMLLVADYRLGVGGPGNVWMLTRSVTQVAQDMEWHHYAVSVDRDNPAGISMYIDGVFDSTNDPTGFASVFIKANQDYQIGSMNNNCLNGLLDELTIFNTALTEEEIFSVMTGGPILCAFNPNPKDGAMLLATWANLSWRAGDFAVSHDVYIGDDFDAVNAGAEETFVGNQTETMLVVGFPGFPVPDGLVPGTTYYWRVDEVNEADPDSPWKGPVWSFSIAPKTAYHPNPADGAEFVDPNTVNLTWTEGFGAILHTVYFGEDYDEVNNAAGGAPLGSATYSPGPLERETVYYWRVDEFDAVETHKGDVWSFTTPGAVGNPQPAYDATDVGMNAILSWTPSDSAASHELYFGTDKEAVRSGDTAAPEYKGSKTLGDESYYPGLLDAETTYYWRVDEVDAQGNAAKGPLWIFTTGAFLLVDDFESYTDDDPNNEAIWQTWIDGFGVADNGAQVGYLMPPYAEQMIIHGGSQSMPLLYTNDAGVTNSEASMTLTTLKDWTEGGVTELSFWFRGSSTNAAEPLYVAISDTAIEAYDDPGAVARSTWTQWQIPLQAFADQGVNLSNVDKIAIGLGTKAGVAAPGGTGTIYVDDIRLIRP